MSFFIIKLEMSSIPFTHQPEELLRLGSPDDSLQNMIKGLSQLLLDLVAVGPVGPIIETIVGSDFFGQQLSGDEEEDGQGQGGFHAGFCGGQTR